MTKVPYTYWKDDTFFLGYINEFPNYTTQGSTREELIENLKDLYKDLAGNIVPDVRRQAVMKV